jgi:hypothetical protein
LDPSDQVPLLPEDGNRTEINTGLQFRVAGYVSLVRHGCRFLYIQKFLPMKDGRCSYFGNKISSYRRVQEDIREKLGNGLRDVNRLQAVIR